MAKSKEKTSTVINMSELSKKAARMIANDEEKLYIITSATVKDDFCNYSYEIASGITEGDQLSRKGSLIIHEDLRLAFKALNIHLAVICEEVDHKIIKDVERIEDYDDELHKEGSIEHRVSCFHTSSFSITGTGENEGVILTGLKRLSTGEQVKLTSPQTPWSGNYPFINELKAAIDIAVYEVEEYMNGKSKPKLVQPEIPGLENNEENI